VLIVGLAAAGVSMRTGPIRAKETTATRIAGILRRAPALVLRHPISDGYWLTEADGKIPLTGMDLLPLTVGTFGHGDLRAASGW